MRVSELSKSLRITPDTVRYYTRIALLSPKKGSINGYKYYTESDQQRLRFILSARQLGFSIKEIKQILTEADKGHTACPLVRELLQKRLEATEHEFQEALALRNRMQQAMQDWQDKPDKAPTGHMICHLIEEFSEQPAKES
ncbi:MAG: MerR family transcriptional regulator [Piscirickettsiaceae bacterium]|nr:MAG: MerR family transcriptional regulator [Piscirickettsiaceae bacterium]